MIRTARTKADAQFTATQKKSEIILKEKEKLRKEKAEKMNRLRALRLEKEAADKKAIEKVKPETIALLGMVALVKSNSTHIEAQ